MSLTIKGLLAFALGWIANKAAVNLEPQSISTLADNLIYAVTIFIQVAGILLAYYGRVRHGDITWYGKKLN